MNPLAQIGILVVQTLGGLYVLIVMLRFLLGVARADFYNPISQFIVRATNPPLLPLRRVIPSVRGIDLSGLLLAAVIEFGTIYLSALFAVGPINPLPVLAWAALGLVSFTVYIFFACMIGMIIISFIAPHTRQPLAILTVQLVRPICAPFQRLIPPMGGIDISPVFVFLLLNIARVLVEQGAAAVGLVGGLRHLVPGFF